MNFTIKLNTLCHTNGKGLWTDCSREVKHSKAMVRLWLDDPDVYMHDFGELMVFFRKSDWQVQKYGLIYTDPLWIKEFREHLVSIGFTKTAANDVDYSEQGMQSHNYVSLDIGKKFIQNYLKLYNKDSKGKKK